MMGKDVNRCRSDSPEEKPRRLPLIFIILMVIGIFTVLYFFVVYILIPFLALMTVS